MHRLNPNAPVFVPRHLQVEPTSIPVALEEHPSPGIVSTDVSPSTSSVPPGTTHSDHDDPNSRVKPIRFGNIDPELVGLDHGPTTFDSSTHVDGGTSHLDHDDPLPRDRPLRFGNMDPELVGLDDDSMTLDSSTDIAGGTTHSGHDDPTASRSGDIDPELVGLDHDTTTLDPSIDIRGGTTNSGHDSSDDPTASRSNDIDPELVGLDNDTTTLDSSTNFGGGSMHLHIACFAGMPPLAPRPSSPSTALDTSDESSSEALSETSEEIVTVDPSTETIVDGLLSDTIEANLFMDGGEVRAPRLMAHAFRVIGYMARIARRIMYRPPVTGLLAGFKPRRPVIDIHATSTMSGSASPAPSRECAPITIGFACTGFGLLRLPVHMPRRASTFAYYSAGAALGAMSGLTRFWRS